MSNWKYTIQRPFAFSSIPDLTYTGKHTEQKAQTYTYKPSSAMYLFIFGAWLTAVMYYGPRLMQLLDFATTTWGQISLSFFVIFIHFAWLYGFYNIGVVLFAFYFKKMHAADYTAAAIGRTFTLPSVAVLYTTCNDFVEESAESCVNQKYADFKVYILDDSSDPEYKNRIDAFASRYSDSVIVVRRPDRKGFKAGNMNYGLTHVAVKEKYFGIADADEILPPDFLSRLVPVMESDARCSFVQANHRANPKATSTLAKSLGIGIDIHWKWYQPLRNRYGFVMFLGHGALLRRQCWEEIGGFPDIVSEDLGFAIHAREKGYHGRFAEDVMCYEDFPDTVRAFRIRHMKWTKGTCEFLAKRFTQLVRSRKISLVEKLDILFPTMNLPLTLLYLLFMVNANLFIPILFGHQTELTFVVGGENMHFPIITLDPRFQVIFTPDFFAITMLTFFAPVLCFILELANRPGTLFRFLGHSTALYAALSPLSSVGVLSYMVSGKAVFLVTGEKKQLHVDNSADKKSPSIYTRIRRSYQDLIRKSHPDQMLVQGIEIGMGLLFGIACVMMFQISFFGLCMAFILLPVMHHLAWTNRWVKSFVFIPFFFIILGVLTAGLSVFGMQAVFFGYGFHF